MRRTFRRTGRIGAWALAGLLALWAAGSLDLRPRAQAGIAPAAGPLALGPGLWAGAATVDLTPARPVPLGGFGSRRGAIPSAVRDPVHARALVLAGPGGTPAVALVALEAVLVPDVLAEALRRRLRADGIEDLVLIATHTHNGPGGYWDHPIARVAGLGGHDPAFAAALEAGIAGAVRQARAALRPVTAEVAETEGPALCRSRVPGRTPDRRLTQVVFRDAAETPVGRIVVFACHPTVLGARDHRLSAEWPGVAAGALPGVTLVLQGAGGDVTSGPLERFPPGADAEARMVHLGEAVAEAARGVPGTAAEGAVWQGLSVRLPAATGDTLAPAGLRALAGNVLARLAPRTARIGALRVGDLTLAFVPAEVVSPLAARWEAGATAPLRVVSLADGYLGYLELPEALARRAGESRQAYFGADAVALVGTAVDRAVRAVSADPTPSDPRRLAAPARPVVP